MQNTDRHTEEKMEEVQNMKIVTFACDLYADIAPAYHYLWNKKWPDCTHELVYVTNQKPLNIDATVHFIRGQDIEYGRRLRKFVSLHCQDDEPILLMMIDYLARDINIGMVEQAFELCSRDDVVHCRLRPMPRPQLQPPDKMELDPKKWGGIDKSGRYSLSLQPGIWNPKSLAKCIKDSWSPWQCETQGSRIANKLPGYFLCVQKPAITHHNYYKKRKPFSVNWVKKNVPAEFWPGSIKGRKR